MLKFKIRILFSVLCCLLSCPVLAAPPAKRAAWPDAAAVAKAQSHVEDLYGERIAKAKKPGEKAALGREMFKVAGESGGDAAKFVLLQTTRDLGVEGQDWSLTLCAIAAIVDRFELGGPTDQEAQIRRGDALRDEAILRCDKPADERLAMQLAAAEWYVRAKRDGKGLQSQIAEKRLTELAGVLGFDVKLLIGTWEVIAKNGYRAQWSFRPDGTVQSTKGIMQGTWSLETFRIKISWNEKAWETFNLPLNRSGVSGDSWLGKNFIKAKKKN